MDRRGESEESGDDETKRKSLNGEVDSLQAPSTGETTLAWGKHLKWLSLWSISLPLLSLPFLVPEESPVDMDTITLDPDEEVKHSVFQRVDRWMLLALWFIVLIIYLGCGSGPLSHWEDWGSGGSSEGKGESIKCFFVVVVVLLRGNIVGLSSYWIKICIDLLTWSIN